MPSVLGASSEKNPTAPDKATVNYHQVSIYIVRAAKPAIARQLGIGRSTVFRYLHSQLSRTIGTQRPGFATERLRLRALCFVQTSPQINLAVYAKGVGK